MESITFAQRAVKVNVTRKNLSHLHGHAVGHAGIVGCSKQAAANGATAQSLGGRQRDHLHARSKTARFALNDQALEMNAIVGGPALRECVQQTVLTHLGLQVAASAPEQKASRQGIRTQKLSCGGIQHTQPG